MSILIIFSLGLMVRLKLTVPGVNVEICVIFSLMLSAATRLATRESVGREVLHQGGRRVFGGAE